MFGDDLGQQQTVGKVKKQLNQEILADRQHLITTET